MAMKTETSRRRDSGFSEKRWIFLRGLGRHSEHWGSFVSDFKKAFPTWSVELLDLAGNGTEAGRESYLQIGSYVEDLRRRSKQMASGPVSILAISMGAMVAAEWARLYPEEIDQLVLINTSSKAESRFYERLKPQNYLRMLDLYRRGEDFLFREKTILEMTASPLADLEKIAERQSQLVPTAPYNFLRQILASSSFCFAEAKPNVEILILNSTVDNLVDPICTERLARRWGVSLRTHPAGDHDLPLVDGKWVIEQVGEMMTGARS